MRQLISQFVIQNIICQWTTRFEAKHSKYQTE